jgi:serine/threonine protein kinase
VGDYSLECALPSRPYELAFRAAHVLLPRRVRLVILHPTYGSRETASHMLREACLVEALRHPGIPRLYECGRLSAGRPWLAVELVEGPTLAEAIAEQPLPAIEVLGIVRELAAILAHAHARGVVHGAVVPASIVRAAEQLFLCDWSHSLVEQDPRADIHALGVVAYQALTQAAPRGPVLRQCPAVPYEVASLVDRMLAEDPAHRPTAAEIVAEAARSSEALEAIELALDGSTDPSIEDVVLVDITADLDLTPGPIALRWTPPLGTAHPDTIPITIGPSRRR